MSTPLLLLRLLTVLGVFRLVGWPLARAAFPGLPATAYAVAGGVGLVLSAHVTWLLVHAGMRLDATSIGAGLAVAAGAAWLAWRARGEGEGASVEGIEPASAAAPPLAPRPRDVIIHHLGFAAAFTLALLITAKNPAVDPDSERPMDYAMMNAVLAARSLPLEDPWLAGERVSYYDYGYYTAAHLAILVGPAERFFPVAVALVWATLFAGSMALGRDLAGWRGGVLAPVMVAVAGNLDGLVQTLDKGLGVGLDWFHGARVIDGSITEFPYFTLLWGDLHPYAIALTLWPILLAVAATLSRGQAGATTAAVGAVAYAALIATHTWDAVPVAALLAVVALGLVPTGARSGGGIGHLVGVPAAVLLGGALLALPFLLHVPTGGRGLAWVSAPSRLGELATMWGAQASLLAAAAIAAILADERLRRVLPLAALGGALIVAAWPTAGLGLATASAGVALGLSLRTGGDERLAWAMAAVGAGLVAGVEMLFVDDFYTGQLERMNTVFKAYVEAWVLLTLAAAVLVSRAHAAARTRPARMALTALALAALGAGVVYPLRATPARAGSLAAPRPLDARLALRERYPEDADAVDALRRLPRGRLVETTGNPYTWNGRFATFTGYPAVIGWGRHEAGWRNDWKPVLDRTAEVKAAYAAATTDEMRALCADYGVRYVVAGELEREQYGEEALVKLAAMGREVVRAGDTVIYEVGP